MTRILVLSPHPDDEVVGCAVAIRRAVAARARVFVVHLTTGIPPASALWPWQRGTYAARVARRWAEAGRVAARLGVTLLGFQPWPSRTLKDHIDEALELVAAVVAEQRIDELWVPAWEGAHQDHDVANVIGARFRTLCKVLEFAEYNFADGKVQAGTFALANGTEATLPLSVMELRWKANLLRVYRSERANLAHCRGAQEALRPLAAYDYTRPPHAGRLFRERFQWVPFAHPRIDFERSRAVRERLMEWLERRPANASAAFPPSSPPGDRASACPNPRAA